MVIGHLYIFFEEMSVQILHPFFSFNSSFLLYFSITIYPPYTLFYLLPRLSPTITAQLSMSMSSFFAPSCLHNSPPIPTHDIYIFAIDQGSLGYSNRNLLRFSHVNSTSRSIAYNPKSKFSWGQKSVIGMSSRTKADTICILSGSCGRWSLVLSTHHLHSLFYSHSHLCSQLLWSTWGKMAAQSYNQISPSSCPLSNCLKTQHTNFNLQERKSSWLLGSVVHPGSCFGSRGGDGII